MAKKNSSPRDNAKPTGNMSAEESHHYAQEFQKENFGDSINVGGGRAEGADASATTQSTAQRTAEVPQQFDDQSQIPHQARGRSEHSDKKNIDQ